MEKDHVPPDCIFPADNKPQNLFTVRCCSSCHDEFDVLDERMRNYIAILAGSESGEVGEKALRVLQRSPKLLRKFFSHTKEHPSLLDDDGNSRLLFYFNDDELNRWLVRIVKGLYFRKHKQIIEENHKYKIEKLSELIPQPSMTFPMDEGLELRPYFVYGVIQEPNLDYWLLIFYDSIMFSVTVEYKN